ncbi:MAG: hypothetical protein H5T70_12310 [Chloroflexi bacterium]|nr:hypothetical protein [Chloroflexota bacterium]
MAILVLLVGIAATSALVLLQRARERAMSYEREVVAQAIAIYNTYDVPDGGVPISASPDADPVRIDPKAPSAPPFAKYLDSATKYYYTWEDGGRNLNVYSRADRDSILPQ